MGMSRSEAWRLWEASRKAVEAKRIAVPLLPLPPLLPPMLAMAVVAIEARLHSDGC